MWQVLLRDSFYSLELPDAESLDEAIDEAESSYGSEWSEVFNGKEGISREELREER